jgi:hypothetical protein
MSRSRRLLAAVGIVAFLLAVVGVFTPDSLGGLTRSLDSLVDRLGGPWVFVAAFGVLALAAGLAAQAGRAVGGLDEATPPDPEGVHEVPRPGHRLDAFIEGETSLPERVFGDRHERVRERLRAAALATLRRSGLTREEALEALERGSWTDDPVAAAFLSETRTPGLGERVAGLVRGESAFQRGARRAAEAVADRGGER